MCRITHILLYKLMCHATLNFTGCSPAYSHARGICASDTADRLTICNLDTLHVVQLYPFPSRISHMHLSSCSELVICGQNNKEALHESAAHLCEPSLLRDSSTWEPLVERMSTHINRLSQRAPHIDMEVEQGQQAV